jgi:hypothetical protein
MHDPTGKPAPAKRSDRTKVPDETPAAGFPLVGSDVLDVVGSRGVPKRNMHDIIHAPDDEIAEHALGPRQEASVSFRPDPEVGDAGADFAEEFGRSYLQSATTGEDVSEIEGADDLGPSDVGGLFAEVDAEGNTVDPSDVEETGGLLGGQRVDNPPTSEASRRRRRRALEPARRRR